ncbi:DUF1707 domain-containing protein [Nocardia sp. NPDC051030]|uniref:DUF1707 SHOCT-like domain-containing protein n=1 Tax=Nocardia sp. NPDC051030 TaxID=3155162 RepID=UPI00342519FB
MTDFQPALYGPPTVRAGTAEREQAAAALSKHFADGRLDVGEYDERVGRAYSAKTVGELVELFTDLPQPAPPPSAPMAAGPMPNRQRPWPVLPVAVIAALVLGIVIMAVTHVFPLFIFPLLFFAFFRGRRIGRSEFRQRRRIR